MDGVTKYHNVEKQGQDNFFAVLKRNHYLNKANKALMHVYKDQESLERHINEKNFKKTLQWKERDNREKVIKSKAIFSIILGIALIGAFLIIDFSFVQNSESVYKPLFSSLLNVISMITSMIVGIGVSTLCLDFFSYVQYTRERLKEVVVEKDFIETLADDEKKELVDKLEKSLYFRSEKELSRSLYENIKARIIPLLEEPYLERYTIHIDCYIDEEKGKKTQEEINNSLKIDIASLMAHAPVVEFEKKEAKPASSFKPKYEKKEVNEDTIKGRVIKDDVVTIKSIVGEEDSVTIDAEVFGQDEFEPASKEFKILTLKLTDYTDSIYAKMFSRDEEEFNAIKKKTKPGAFIRVRGATKLDRYSGNELVLNIRDINATNMKKEKRVDDAPRKRVELHAHTKMSQMDGVMDEVAYIKQAIAFGHKSAAVRYRNCTN